jgi:PKD repeat protein
MKRKVLHVIFFLLIISVISSACNLIPKKLKIETSSELGPETLSRIDDINQVLDRGVEIGPETRQSIESINQTIAEGVKFGFTGDNLERIDEMLRIVEQGVGIKVGLDSETNATVNHLINTLEDAPDQWENTMTEIIRVLESSTSAVASDIADEISDLMKDARINTQYVTASVGIEFRCNVDFLSARAGDTVDQFIGRSLVGQLRSIVTGETYEKREETPWVCQIIPDQIDLESISSGFVFQDAVIKVSGYNYNQNNLPTAYIVDEAGQPLESVLLYPFLTSPYQLQLNLQGIDFSTIPERSRLVFYWPGSDVTYALSVVFPAEQAQPTPIVTARLLINSASVDIHKGPAVNYHIIGRGEFGAEYEVIGRNGDGTWWQIDYDGDEGWVKDIEVTRNEVPAPVVSIPLPPPTASFVMTPGSGAAPLVVKFQDTSSGQPFRWTWEFGEGFPEYAREATHQFTQSGTYTVTLTAENDLGYGTASQQIVVDQPSGMVIAPLPTIQLQLMPGLSGGQPKPTFPAGSVVFKNFSGLKAPVHFNTTIRSDMYECGIVGMAALNGGMMVKSTGNIIHAFMVPEGDSWWIHADVRSPVMLEETWSVGVMCMMKNYADGYQVFRRVRVDPGVKETVDLADLHIRDGYTCGVIGMGAWWGDVNEHGTALNIMKVFTRKNPQTTNWELTANFNTHGDHEEVWDVDLLCIYDDPSVFRWTQLPMISGGQARDTGFSSTQYACGITGMSVSNGDIAASDRVDIIKAYPFIGANGNWFVRVDFTTSGVQEQWDLDLLCVDRSASILSGNWSDGWVP